MTVFTEEQLFEALQVKKGQTPRELRRKLNVSKGAIYMIVRRVEALVGHGFAIRRSRPITDRLERQRLGRNSDMEYMLTKYGVSERKKIRTSRKLREESAVSHPIVSR